MKNRLDLFSHTESGDLGRYLFQIFDGCQRKEIWKKNFARPEIKIGNVFIIFEAV